MKRQLFNFLILLTFVFSVSAQKAATARTDETQANLRKHIEFLASDKLEGRRTGEPGAKAAAAYVATQFAKLKLKPGATDSNGKATFLQPFPYVKKDAPSMIGYNVIGILQGTDPKLKGEAIVIGAHYDHLGHGGEGSLAANSTEIHHGADDNASGTAAIIELARKFAREKNDRTLIFIAFSGEEEGLFGSKFYVNNPVFPLEDTIAMINLDMVGRMHDRKLNIGGIGTAGEWKDLVTKANKQMYDLRTGFGVSAGVDLILNEDGFGPSDHSSFYTKKIPVLFFFTGSPLDYHKPTDTADKINYPDEVVVMELVATIVKSIDENSTRPTYAVGKSSGMQGPTRSGISISLGTIPSYTDSTDGMVIDGVRDDSPAAKAGLQSNDKIVKLAGMDVKNIRDYMSAMGAMKAGEEYEIVIVRSKETLNLRIVPAPAAPRN